MQKATIAKVARIAAMWIPVILLAFIFVPQGWSKFDDASGWARAFRHWGYPDWFRMTIGVLELGGVALMLAGRTAALGALTIIVVMLGAWATHLIFDGGRHMTSEVVPLVLATTVLVLRRKQLSGLVDRLRRRQHAPAPIPGPDSVVSKAVR